MVVDFHSWSITRGNLSVAREFNRKACAIHEDHDLVLRCRQWMPLNGKREMDYAVFEFESLATMQEYWTWFWQKGSKQLIDEWDPGWVVEGSFERYQYQVPE